MNRHEKLLYEELEQLTRECNLSIEILDKANCPNTFVNEIQDIRNVVIKKLLAVGKRPEVVNPDDHITY